MRLRGVDVLLDAVEGQLDFYWGSRGAWGAEGQLSLLIGSCLSVTAQPIAADGSLHLVFRFRPTGPKSRGGSRMAIGVVVAADGIQEAWGFVDRLAREYHIPKVTWLDTLGTGPGAGSDERKAESAAGAGGRKAAEPGPPSRIPADDPDWLNAPTSDTTEALFAWVTERLADADA